MYFGFIRLTVFYYAVRILKQYVFWTAAKMEVFYEMPSDFLLQISHIFSLTYALHQHYKLEMIYVLKGTVSILYENEQMVKKKDIHAGELFFVAPYTAHSYIKPDGNEISANSNFFSRNDYFIITFNPNIDSKYSRIFLTNRILNPLLRKEEIPADVCKIIHRMSEPCIVEEKKEIIKCYLVVMLERLLECFKLQEISGSIQKNDSVSIVDYINEHYTEPDINLKTISAHLKIGKYNISRFFSNNMNTCLRKYINSLRIVYAKMLLRNTNETIIDITLETGYTEPQSFNRIFKNFEGITPSEYRRKYKDPFVRAENDRDDILYYQQISKSEQILYLRGNKRKNEFFN